MEVLSPARKTSLQVGTGSKPRAWWWRGLYPHCPGIWREETLRSPFSGGWVAAPQQQSQKLKLFFQPFRLHFSREPTRHSPPRQLCSEDSEPSQRIEGLSHPKTPQKRPQQREEGGKNTQSIPPPHPPLQAACICLCTSPAERGAERSQCTHGRLYMAPPYIHVDV